MFRKHEGSSSDQAGFSTSSVYWHSSGEGQSMTKGRRVIVANMLPLKAIRDPSIACKWRFELDRDVLVLQLKDGFPPDTEVVHVGCLPVEIDLRHEDDVAKYLLVEFKCLPTFMPVDLFKKFYHGFCKHYLWPLFHYMLPVTANVGATFDTDTWQAYVLANKIFADRVMDVINSDEDSVWVHDYHLMILPTLLRKKHTRVKLGFFLHSPFPSSEIYRTIPVREEILRALLDCDLVGFHAFDYARHFLSCCHRMLGLEYQSRGGYIGLEHLGRTITVKILPVGVHLGQIESVMSEPYTINKIRELKRRYDGNVVLLGVDDLDLFKGISLKFMAMGMLLGEHPNFRGKVVLVQVVNAPSSYGHDIRDVQEEIAKIARDVNEKYGDPTSGYQPIVCVNGPVSSQDKVAYYSISECVVVNAVRDGMNLVPYKYTVVRQRCEQMNNALRVGEDTPRKSVIIVSEFIGCSPSLSGAIRVNPWDVRRLSEAMAYGIVMCDSQKEMRHQKHYKYIMSHDVSYWARSFDQDLHIACAENYRKRCWDLGFGLFTKFIALGPDFMRLSVGNIVSAYKKSEKRIILLDYDGTILPQKRVDKSPGDGVISVLKSLCNDTKNIVFIVSGRGKEPLAEWFSECETLGLSAEHGYFTRWNKSMEWVSSRLATDFNWQKIVVPIMRHYTEATDGSSIEEKETAFVWHHEDADRDFGSWQAKELLNSLECALAKDPVVVCKGQEIVEVKPQGVSKGLAVNYILDTLKIRGEKADFILCIGDDRSDEDMFEAVSTAADAHMFSEAVELFPCTVGQKPSLARYYLDETEAVMKLLQSLSAASALEDRRPW